MLFYSQSFEKCDVYKIVRIPVQNIEFWNKCINFWYHAMYINSLIEKVNYRVPFWRCPVFYKALQWFMHYINQSFSLEKTPHTIWGVFFEDFLKYWQRYNGTALQIIKISQLLELLFRCHLQFRRVSALLQSISIYFAAHTVAFVLFVLASFSKSIGCGT